MSTIVFCQWLYLAIMEHVDHCILSGAISGYEGACRPLFSVRGYIWLWRGMSTIVFCQGLYLAMRGHVDHCFLSGAISGYGGACRPLFSVKGYIWL